MKSITIYINEKLIINKTSINNQISNNGVDNHINSLIKDALSNLNFKEFKSFSLDDPNRFNISKENEKLFIDAFEDGKLKAISSMDYYDASHRDKFKNLSPIEKAKIDRTLGDVVLIDDNGEAKYYIDLKISDSHIGAISMGSLSSFNNNGIYICINKANGSYIIVSHKVIAELIKNGNIKINSVIKSYKGNEVEFNGQKYNSEDFIKGDDIEIHIK